MSEMRCSAPLQILYLDDTLLVLDKPAGLLAVPGRGPDKQDCLSTRAAQHLPGARIVHRLDMSTSGLMVMARTLEAQRALSLAFSDRLVHKRYVAVVAGCMASPASPNAEGWGVIDLPIAVDWPRRPLRIIDSVSGKPSLTRWRIESGGNDLSASIRTTRLLLEPVTGRSHQLRVHLKALGHAIVGDALYASEVVAAASDRLLLHASALAFPHPVSGQRMRFRSDVPF